MDKRTPIDMQEFLNDISVPDLSGPLELSSKEASHEQKDIFAIEKRKAWDKSVEARCDFTRRVRLTRRADTFFISLWQKSLYGRTLTDIKGDDSMVAFFADSISPLIRDILGEELNTGGVVYRHHSQTSPSRQELRHSHQRNDCFPTEHPVLRGCCFLPFQAAYRGGVHYEQSPQRA